MKVKVSFTVDIDVDAWDKEYLPGDGVHGVDEIRSDVRRYIQNGAMAQLDSLGMLR